MRINSRTESGPILRWAWLLLGMAVSLMGKPGESVTAAFITNDEDPHFSQYLAALADTAEIATVFLVDASGTKAPKARDQLGDRLAAVYPSIEALLSEKKPDVAVISLEPRLAVHAVTEALNADCHVIVEKPGFLDVDELADLIAKAETKQRFIILSLANRTTPAYLKARELVEEGKLGRIFGVEMHLIADQTRLGRPKYQRSWLAQKSRAGGGHLAWLGIHWLDLAMYITGAKITELTGFTANVGGQPIDVEDSAVVAMRFDQGFLGTMTSGYYLKSGYHSHLKVWGENGWLEVNLFGGETPMRYFSSKDDKPGIKSWHSPAQGDSGYARFIRQCVRAILSNGVPPVTNQETMRIVKTIRAAYEAAEGGFTVVLDEARANNAGGP